MIWRIYMTSDAIWIKPKRGVRLQYNDLIRCTLSSVCFRKVTLIGQHWNSMVSEGTAGELQICRSYLVNQN